MKKFLFFVLLGLTGFYYSCKKDDPVPYVDQFLGNWAVYESTRNLVLSVSVFDTFNSTTARCSDTSFYAIQTFRSPKPLWVKTPGWPAADSIELIPRTNPNIFDNNDWNQGEMGTFSDNKDTLHIHYIYGTGGVNYRVYQTWIRK